MLKTLGAQVKEYRNASIITPIFMLLEVAMETIIPLLMASIVNKGINAGDTKHIYVMGAWMIVAALFFPALWLIRCQVRRKSSHGPGKKSEKGYV